MRSNFNRLHTTTFIAIAVVFGANDALAGNLSFPNDTAVSKFTDVDHALMIKTAEAVLDDAKTPTKMKWLNAQTNATGTVESLMAFKGPKDESCKRLLLTNHAGGRESKANYTVCDLDGWRLVPNDYAPLPKKEPAAGK